MAYMALEVDKSLVDSLQSHRRLMDGCTGANMQPCASAPAAPNSVS